MEKKSDDEFDKVYGDSVFSITEDAQYPIFDAQLAKEGIINHSKPGSKRRKLNPENNCVQNSQFAHLESNTNFINKPQIPIPESNEIKIDEPLQLSREITESVPKFNRTESPSILNAPTLMNRFGSFGRGMMIGPSTAKPLPIKNASLQKPVPSPTEKAPIMKVNSTVVQKVCGPSTNSCFSKVVPKTLNNGTQIKPLNQPILSIPPKPATTPPQQAKCIIIEETKKEPEEKYKAEKSHKGRKPAKGSKKKEIEKKEKLQEEDIDDESESKSKLGLSGRKDVVYKTLLRSVKRYYSSEFESRTEYNGLTKSKQEKRCMKIIERFTREIFSEHLKSERSENEQMREYVSGIDFNDICSFILALIIPSYVKRNCRFTPTYTVYDTFYECLYRYSHKRLESALAIDSVACVFKIFLEGPVFQNLLENDGTLSKNREAFESAKQEFLDIISKRGSEEYPAVIS